MIFLLSQFSDCPNMGNLAQFANSNCLAMAAWGIMHSFNYLIFFLLFFIIF